MTGWRARVVLGLLGAFVIASVADGRYLLYVRPGMKAVLIVTGAVLVLLAVHGALREWRQHDRAGLGTGGHAEHSGSEQGHRDGHLHGRAGTAWLLLAPVACSALLAPPALGSYSAARATDAAATRPAGPDPATGSGGDVAWPPLPPGDVVPLTLGDFITRARWDPGASLAGRTVRLTGFVVPAQEERAGGSGWTLARMAIMCCAADAAVYRVRVEDIPAGT